MPEEYFVLPAFRRERNGKILKKVPSMVVSKRQLKASKKVHSHKESKTIWPKNICYLMILKCFTTMHRKYIIL